MPPQSFEINNNQPSKILNANQFQPHFDSSEHDIRMSFTSAYIFYISAVAKYMGCVVYHLAGAQFIARFIQSQTRI